MENILHHIFGLCCPTCHEDDLLINQALLPSCLQPIYPFPWHLRWTCLYLSCPRVRFTFLNIKQKSKAKGIFNIYSDSNSGVPYYTYLIIDIGSLCKWECGSSKVSTNLGTNHIRILPVRSLAYSLDNYEWIFRRLKIGLSIRILDIKWKCRKYCWICNFWTNYWYFLV